MSAGVSMRADLAPVRAALLAAARAQAGRRLAAADAEADAVLAAARAQAAAMVEQARTEGAADATIALAGARARARREARAIVMAARRDAYRSVREAGRAAVRRLRAEPGYPGLRDRLATALRGRLGPDPLVVEGATGGMVAETAGRRVDYSLDGFADRAVDALGAELEGLWAP